LLPARGCSCAWSRLVSGQEGSEPVWEIHQEPGLPEEFWVLVSQDCDISAKAEPRVELLRGYWTADKSTLHTARLNSVRGFLLGERQRGDGKSEGLVVDATRRLLLEKSSLLELEPARELGTLDSSKARRFRQWLAQRYDRPAIPDVIVNAVQKPLVKALDKLSDDDELWRCLSGVEEVRFSVPSRTPPFDVALLFMKAPGARLSAVDELELKGWFEEVLTKEGVCRISGAVFRDASTVSLANYLAMERLSLDRFSLEGHGSEEGGS
jgi:hypothetical protein